MQETLRIYDSLIFKAQSIELLCFLTTIQKIQKCNSCLNFLWDFLSILRKIEMRSFLQGGIDIKT